MEYLIVEIQDGCSKCIVACAYNPNRNCSPQTFFSVLSEFAVLYEHIIVCGDFNADLFKNDSHAFQIKDLASALGLEIVNTNYPTRYAKNCTPSLLDLAIVSDISSVLIFDQLSLDCISDHDLLFCTYDINFTHTAVPLSFTYKDFCSINMDALQFSALTAPWGWCRLSSDPEEKLYYLQEIITQLYIRHVPTKTVNIRNKNCPWFTTEVIDTIKARNKLYSKWKHKPSNTNWLAYKAMRNHSTEVVRNAKKIYMLLN